MRLMGIVQSINSALKRVPAWPLYIVLTIPGVWVYYKAFNNQLGPDPLRALENQLGVWALQLLVAVLLITPLRNMFNLQLIKFRRALGLMAFYYALTHMMTYFWLDQGWYWPDIIKDVTKRPYIMIGMSVLIALLPLAITSNNLSIRKIGPLKWRKLHRLTYYAAIGGAVHYVMLEKTWQQEPLTYVAIVLALLGYRAWKGFKKPKRA